MTPSSYDRRTLLRLGAGGLAGAVAAPLLAERAAAARAPRIAFGVNQHLTENGVRAAVMREQIRLAKQLGAEVSRSALKWKQVEKDRGRYDWSVPDRAAELCHGAGIQMLWTVNGGAPRWMHPAIPSSTRTPGLWKAWLERYQEFVHAAAQRYRHVVYWELWNEANLRRYWNSDNTEKANPHDYKLWYQAIRRVLRAQLPDAKIAVGGLTNARLGNPNQPSGQQFLANLLARPTAPIDRLAVHIYCQDGHSPDVRTGGNNFLDFDLYRQQLLRARHGDTRMWITEWGWSTGAGGVTPQMQARYVGRSLYRITHDWERSVEVATIFIDYDRPRLHFGLFGPPPSFTPKPAATVFRNFVEAYRSRHRG